MPETFPKPSDNPLPPSDTQPDVPVAAASKPHILRRIISNNATPWVAATLLVLGYGVASQDQMSDRISAIEDTLKQSEQEQDRLVAFAAQAAGVDVKTIQGIGLTPPEELPGYGTTVNPSHRADLRGSSVSLLTRPKTAEGRPQDWFVSCSGNIVDVAGHRVVATAASCFDSEISRLKAPDTKTKATAYDIAQVATQEYAIMPTSTPDAMPATYGPDLTPLGRVQNLAVIPTGRTALLGIDTTSFPVLQKGDIPFIDTLPALPARTTEKPAAGQQVALAPRLNSKNNSRQDVSGVLLGNITFTGDSPTNDSFLVGLKADNPPQTDGCGLGAIGILADGSFAGPAYESINPYASPDDAPMKLQIDNFLQVDSRRFATICEIDNTGMGELGQLFNAFGHQPAPELMAPPK